MSSHRKQVEFRCRIDGVKLGSTLGFCKIEKVAGSDGLRFSATCYARTAERNQ